jgi:hypothetical protein
MMYSLVGAPFYDERNQCYKKIIRINKFPSGPGPLQQIVKRVRSPRLSHFDTFSDNCRNSNAFNPPCIFVICNPLSPHQFLTVDELPELMSFLIDNGYKIDTSITKMLMKSNVKPSNDLICYISDITTSTS